MKSTHFYLLLAVLAFFSACRKDFLDKKPNSSIVVPKALNELQALLENHFVMNVTGGLAQLSSDDYTVPDDAGYQALTDQVTKNAYVWNKDIYAGQVGILDWNSLYKTVFYANNVLHELDQNTYTDSKARDNLKGWALFSRSFAFYDLVNNFAPVYQAGSAARDLGIPLRTDPGIDYLAPRSTVKESYDRILSDLHEAIGLLNPDVVTANPNRPGKPAAFALLARIYLYTGDYTAAEQCADSCLNSYRKLLDFNKLSLSSITPISYVNDETLFYAAQVSTYAELTGVSATVRPYSISNELISAYQPVNDLRLSLFFINTNGIYNCKRRYSGANTPFTGLTTSEVYLIKAECLARRNEVTGALGYLNNLLVTRYKTGKYVNATAGSKEEALAKILLERRKELVWRGLRWSDIKRLNREGRNIVLTRVLNGTTYTLPPNDPRYTFPIPADEIALSGIPQNIR